MFVNSTSRAVCLLVLICVSALQSASTAEKGLSAPCSGLPDKLKLGRKFLLAAYPQLQAQKLSMQLIERVPWMHMRGTFLVYVRRCPPQGSCDDSIETNSAKLANPEYLAGQFVLQGDCVLWFQASGSFLHDQRSDELKKSILEFQPYEGDPGETARAAVADMENGISEGERREAALPLLYARAGAKYGPDRRAVLLRNLQLERFSRFFPGSVKVRSAEFSGDPGYWEVKAAVSGDAAAYELTFEPFEGKLISTTCRECGPQKLEK